MWQRQFRYLQMCGYLGQRGSGDKTQVSGTWSWILCFGLKLLPQLVKVELLLAESQSFTISLENTVQELGFHAEGLKVNIQCCHLVASFLYGHVYMPYFFHTLKVMTFIPRAVV